MLDLKRAICYTGSCRGYIVCTGFLFPEQLNTLWVMIPPFAFAARADVTSTITK